MSLQQNSGSEAVGVNSFILNRIIDSQFNVFFSYSKITSSGLYTSTWQLLAKIWVNVSSKLFEGVIKIEAKLEWATFIKKKNASLVDSIMSYNQGTNR